MAASNAVVVDADPDGLATALTRVFALVRRGFRDARVRTVSFGYLFAIIAYIQPVGYRSAYPTLASRVGFVRSFADNNAIRLFYGVPHNLLTVDGYTAWRVGGTLAIFGAVFGLLGAVRALRTEEDTGRLDLVLAGPVSRQTTYISALTSIGISVLILGVAEFAGLVMGGLAVGGSIELALATTSVVIVFVGVGTIASQLAPTRKMALELGGMVVGLFLLLRVIADTSSAAGWLRWATPLGWAEQMRPLTGFHPSVLILPVTTTVLLLVVAVRIATSRDTGTGIFRANDSARPRLGMLASPTAQALRSERGGLAVWLGSVGTFAYIIGFLAKSTETAGLSAQVQRELAKLGYGSIVTPAGYLSFVFIFFVLALSLFVCAQLSTVRHEEGDQRLETLFSLPVGRRRWLGGRLLLAGGAAAVMALAAGILSWAGAESGGVAISLPQMLEAGANCLPVAMLFLGFAALAFAVLPRASVSAAYGLVILAFLWDLFGPLLGVPKWLADVTPFEHVGLIPAQLFQGTAALIMIAIAGLEACVALWAFRRRDLAGI